MAVDMFLKLDGIKGESRDSKHKDQIEIMSFSWGVAEPSTGPSPGSGGGTGKVVVQDFSFVHLVDQASAKLMLHCASGEHIKSATLTCRKAGKTQQEFLTYKFEDILISGFQHSDHVPNVPAEQFSLNFAKVTLSYKKTNPDGSLAPAQTAQIANQ